MTNTTPPKPRIEPPCRFTREEMQAIIAKGIEKGWLSRRTDAAAMPIRNVTKGRMNLLNQLEEKRPAEAQKL